MAGYTRAWLGSRQRTSLYRAKPGEMGTGESSKQSGTEEGSTSGKKKAGTKTRLRGFRTCLPARLST
ncbi:unnamed protein product [Callosobruchus maculatus]|uniref:Uncharacterized protein n=1 Tax=Callosobruchus maculatus TaxID=64391 RepID=A0A653D7K5_CALMS|nr:unnamed protein product [Callosobruchus maculatus]